MEKNAEDPNRIRRADEIPPFDANEILKEIQRQSEREADDQSLRQVEQEMELHEARQVEAETEARQARKIEKLLWLIAAMVIAVRPFIAALTFPYGDVLGFIRDYYSDLVFTLFIAVFPTLYGLIFGELPFEALRRKKVHEVNLGQVRPSIRHPWSKNNLPSSNEDSKAGRKQLSDTFGILANGSEKISRDLYTRSGVYLIVGVFIALSGLFFFYLQTANDVDLKSDLTKQLLNLAPRFGILFFIEFVAFFFLKQHRTVMEEFRYYEAIKRHRQEIAALVTFCEDRRQTIDLIDLVKAGRYFSDAGRLQKEETTQIIEARKLEKNESDILEKILDIVGQVKK